MSTSLTYDAKSTWGSMVCDTLLCLALFHDRAINLYNPLKESKLIAFGQGKTLKDVENSFKCGVNLTKLQ